MTSFYSCYQKLARNLKQTAVVAESDICRSLVIKDKGVLYSFIINKRFVFCMTEIVSFNFLKVTQSYFNKHYNLQYITK